MRVRVHKVFWMILLIAIFTIMFLPISLYANNAATRLRLPVRWMEATPLDISFSCPGLSNAQINSVEAAMTQWNGVKVLGSNKSIVNFSVTDNDYELNKIRFTYVDSTWIGKTTYNGFDELGMVEGEQINTVTIYLNQKYEWSTASKAETGKVNTHSIVLHELGHALGVAHCHEISEAGAGPCWSTTCLSNVMYPYKKTNEYVVTFQPYDTSSLQMIYTE